MKLSPVSLKFYWNPATNIHLGIDSGWFPAATAGLSGRSRDLMVCKDLRYLLSGSFTEKVCRPPTGSYLYFFSPLHSFPQLLLPYSVSQESGAPAAFCKAATAPRPRRPPPPAPLPTHTASPCPVASSTTAVRTGCMTRPQPSVSQHGSSCSVLTCGHTFMESLEGSGDCCQAQHALCAGEWTVEIHSYSTRKPSCEWFPWT